MAYLPNDDNRKFTELYNVQRLKSSFVAKDGQVCISTIQRMCAQLTLMLALILAQCARGPRILRREEATTQFRMPQLLILALFVLLGGCATRPVNPFSHVDPNSGYRFEVRQARFKERDDLIILAFSGGGMRAAAFSYGVLEFLRRAEVIDSKGKKIRLLDEVDVITGVSGGSFTALAYGLYGDKLFADYEQRFLKRNVQGEIIARAFNPLNWGRLSGTGWGRSELAAELYDEILFNGATFRDLDRGDGPMIIASATDIASGARFPFHQTLFDTICSDLDAVRLSRAAASSSAVPVVLSPVTFNNYSGTCDSALPGWARRFTDSASPPRPAARAIGSLTDAADAYSDSKDRPYVHLVDGGVADNVAMRGVIDWLGIVEVLDEAGVPTHFTSARRIIVFVVNSLSSPPMHWDASENPPGAVDLLLMATGVPIDHYSRDLVELLRDTAARWRDRREIRDSVTIKPNANPAVANLVRIPSAEIYAVDVSFAALKDKTERDYLNAQPTSFVLPPEAVDRLRAAAGTIILSSPEFQRLLKDVGTNLVTDPAASAGPAKAQ
jgi:NTE family protein